MNYLKELQVKLETKGLSKEEKSKYIRYVNKLLINKMPVIIDALHLSKLMGIKYSILSHYIHNTDNFYKEFEIAKKTGGYRSINAPSLNLKKIQTWIYKNILIYFPVSNYAKGFKKGTSIVDNAKLHTNKQIVYNIDIENFFPTITFKNVYFLFYNIGYSTELSYAFSKLLTYNNSLPQGSPSSPSISNILCFNLDKSMISLAHNIKGHYSRYADDMTISTNNVLSLTSKIKSIKKIVEYNGFTLNDKKERIQYSNQPQFVTGLIVNNGVKVKRRFKKEVDQQIYYCERYGIYNHLKRIGMENKSFYKEYLYGKVNFIKSVEHEVGLQFLERLNSLDWSY